MTEKQLKKKLKQVKSLTRQLEDANHPEHYRKMYEKLARREEELRSQLRKYAKGSGKVRSVRATLVGNGDFNGVLNEVPKLPNRSKIKRSKP